MENLPHQAEKSHLDPEYTNWLAYAASDERKLLVLLTLNQADIPLGISGIRDEMEGLAQSKLPGQRRSIDSIIKNNLLRIGAIEQTETEIEYVLGNSGRYRNAVVPAYTVSAKGRGYMPLAGSLLDWSLKNPELTLGHIFGQPKSTTTSTAAYLRLKTLVLLGAQRQSLYRISLQELADELSVTHKTAGNIISGLLDFDIVTKIRDEAGDTYLDIDPSKHTPILELQKKIDSFFSGDKSTIETGLKGAALIASSALKFKLLYLKSFNSSNQANYDESIEDTLTDIISRLGSQATAQAVAIKYQAQTGRALGNRQVLHNLQKMVNDGKLEVASVKLPQNMNRLTNVYGLVTGDES